MFNKKEMVLITNYKKVQKLLFEGIPVFMVELDGSLVEITNDTKWETVFFHQLKGGNFAIYRRKLIIGTFAKNINIGNWSFTINHRERGGNE